MATAACAAAGDGEVRARPGSRRRRRRRCRSPRFPNSRPSARPPVEWRLGMLGTADTTLIIGLNAAQTRARIEPPAQRLPGGVAAGAVSRGRRRLAGRRPRLAAAADDRQHRRAGHRPRPRPTHSRVQRGSGNHPGHPGAQPHDGSPGKQFPTSHPLQRGCLARIENPARHHAGRTRKRPAGSSSRVRRNNRSSAIC